MRQFPKETCLLPNLIAAKKDDGRARSRQCCAPPIYAATAFNLRRAAFVSISFGRNILSTASPPMLRPCATYLAISRSIRSLRASHCCCVMSPSIVKIQAMRFSARPCARSSPVAAHGRRYFRCHDDPRVASVRRVLYEYQFAKVRNNDGDGPHGSEVRLTAVWWSFELTEGT